MDGTTTHRVLPEIARRRFTVDDVLRMIDAGILGDKEPFELIAGELIEMAHEGALHFDTKGALIQQVSILAGDRYRIAPDGPLRLSDEDWPEPDLYLIPQGMRPSQARGPDALLVIEVSDTTLAFDVGYKAQLYARYGVREYWVVDLINSKILVHHLRPDATYDKPTETAPDAMVSPKLAPEIAVCLADLL